MQQHIFQKLDEATFFLSGMKHYSDMASEKTRWRESVWTPEHYPVVRMFQYHLSGLLSAWKCVANYMCRACNKDATAKTWYSGLKQHTLLEAFSTLRDSDIHDETIHLAVLHTITMGPRPPDAESGFSIQQGILNKLERFKKRQDLANMLSFRPIVPLAEEALEQLKAAAEEGRQRGFFKPM
jgi:hypothetical protein